jgi:hypothetical protein
LTGRLARDLEEKRTMRATLMLGISAVLALATTFDAPARADNNVDVSTSKGQVTVTVKGDFHINKEFPWKLTVNDQKLDKSKFNLAEKTATVSAPSGAGKLKGAYCKKDECHPFEMDVTIP